MKQNYKVEKLRIQTALFIFAFLMISNFHVNAQLAFQGFESTTADNWNYTLSISEYNGEDVWARVSSLGSLTSAKSGTNFWGTLDLDNTSSEAASGGDTTPEHFMYFDPVNIGGNEVKFSLSCNFIGFDSSDFIYYHLYYDNGTDWSSPDVTVAINPKPSNPTNLGSIGNTWQEFSTIIPAGNTYVRMRLEVYNNGNDYSGYDDIKIESVAADSTAPVFENSTPSSSSVAQIGFTLGTDIDEAGTIYYVVVPDGASVPTAANVKAGTGNGGSGQITSGNAAVSTGGFTNNFSITGLTAGTAYDVYAVAEDDESTPNIQASATKIDVTTASLITLTITGLTGSDKTYDDTTVGSATGTANLSGVVGGDVVNLGGTPVFAFATTNVGTGITITTMGYVISGTDAGKYSLTQPALSADITAKSLTVTGLTSVDKTYNGTTAAAASGTAVLSGIETADDVSLGGSPSFAFATANVGTGIAITTTGYTISGTDSGNYSITQPVLSANITALSLSVTGITGADKIYDGTTTASASGTASLSGIIGADDVSLGGIPVFTFTTANVGPGITITTTGYTISGTDSGNYSIIQPTLSADITGVLSVEDILLKNSIYIYPNPVNSELHIKTDNIKVEEVILYNILGEPIKKIKLENNTIDTSIISTGIYLLKIKTDKGIITKKIIKN